MDVHVRHAARGGERHGSAATVHFNYEEKQPMGLERLLRFKLSGVVAGGGRW